MKLLVPVVCLVAVTACGGGTHSTTGQVTEVGERLCLRASGDDGFCFTGPAELFRGVQKGTCVQVTYTASSGVLPVAQRVTPAAPPCSG